MWQRCEVLKNSRIYHISDLNSPHHDRDTLLNGLRFWLSRDNEQDENPSRTRINFFVVIREISKSGDVLVDIGFGMYRQTGRDFGGFVGCQGEFCDDAEIVSAAFECPEQVRI